MIRSPVFITRRPGVLSLHVDILHNKLARNGPNNMPRNPPFHSSSEYNFILINFEQLLTHLNSIEPHLPLITRFFNQRSSSW